jgi:hypothetical protein
VYGQSYDRRNVFGYSDSDVKVSSIYLECLRNKTNFFCPTSNFKKSVYLDDPFSYAFLVQFCVEGILFVLLTYYVFQGNASTTSYCNTLKYVKFILIL